MKLCDVASVFCVHARDRSKKNTTIELRLLLATLNEKRNFPHSINEIFERNSIWFVFICVRVLQCAEQNKTKNEEQMEKKGRERTQNGTKIEINWIYT